MKKIFIVFVLLTMFGMASTNAFAGYTFDFSWGGSSTEGSPEDGKFYAPMGIAIAPSGNVYVADTANRRVQEFTSDGTFVTKWGRNGGDGSWGSGNGEFRNPRAIEVGTDGTVYVGDSENYRVEKFTSNGTFISTFSSYWAEDIAVDTSENTYIGYPNMSGNIRKYTPNGSVIAQWTTGAAPGGLAIDPSGYIYVACRPDNLIQKFTLGGTLVNSWGSYGSGNGQFRDPRGIAIDMNGNVFVADSGNNRIQMFDPNGAFIDSWGSYGSGNGQFNMPYGIAINLEGNVYVADASNNRIQVFTPNGVPGAYNLNLTSISWYQNIVPYNSTGAAAAEMILNFLRTGAESSVLSQDQIYQYAKSPNPYGPELYPDEMAKALGHFDPYDSLISNWSDSYDSLPGGNPYKGYNFSVETFDPSVDTDAINKYMRDICHWLAYTVTKEDWWLDGDLVANPNTPAAIPIYGTYSHWVTVKGFSASVNPCPEPHTNPWNTPDFIVYGFWIKDPSVPGIGQDTYKTTAECAATYFLPLSTTDSYDGKFIQVAEPPLEMSNATAEIPQPVADAGNLQFIGVASSAVETKALSSMVSLSAASASEVTITKNNWRDIVPSAMLSDSDCQAAFNETSKGKPVLVKREDVENADYYLVPFKKHVKNDGLLTSAVIILDANSGYFKEASWTLVPEKFLKVNKNKAVRLGRAFIQRDFSNKLNKLPKKPFKAYLQQRDTLCKDYARLISYVNDAEAQLYWRSNCDYSSSPYEPYWRIDANGYIWYVTQGGKVISEVDLSVILSEIETNRLLIKDFKSQVK